MDEIHESGEMFYDAFHELDVRTAAMLDNQTEMLQLLRQLVPNNGQAPASPLGSPHGRQLNIQL